jgi:hypothetical protein
MKNAIDEFENAMDEMRELRSAITRYEWEGRFSYAALIRQIYRELYLRFNGLPVGDYWEEVN